MPAEVITVTAFLCTHCKELFREEDEAQIHLKFCPVRARDNQKSKYPETEFGNMILKEA